MNDKAYLGIVLLAVLVLSTVAITNVYATHLYSGEKFYTSNPKYCISTGSFFGAFSSSLQTAIANAAADMNALPSSFTLTKIAYDLNVNCFSHIYQKSDNPNYIATSQIALSTPTTINHVNTWTNTYYSWTSSSTCTNPPTSGPYNIRATMRHEFGHWIQMIHPTSLTDNTVMQANFDCKYWSKYQTHDISTIGTVWP